MYRINWIVFPFFLAATRENKNPAHLVNPV